MQSRIYVVMQANKMHRLVNASSAAQAIRHCVRGEYAAKVSTTKELAALMSAGCIVETAIESKTDTNETTHTQGETNVGIN